MKKENSKAVIFDMDGVIFDTERLWKEAFEAANREFGIDLSESYRQSICGKSEEQIRAELRCNFPKLNADEYRDYTLDYVNSSIESGNFSVKDNFEQIANALRLSNLKLALATSSRQTRADKLFSLKKININELFDATVFAEETAGKSKPNPLIFNLAAKKLGEKPENCYVVEDSINGIVAATVGGFIPIMLIDLIPPDKFCKENAAYIINNLSELAEVLIKNENS